MGCHFLFQCVKVKLLNCVRLLVTPWTTAYQASPSMGFFRQEYWSGVPLPSPSSIVSLCLLNTCSTPHPTSSSARWDNQKTTPGIAQCPQGSGAGGGVWGTKGKDAETKSSPVENQGQNLAQKHPWKCLYKTTPGSSVIRRGGQRVRTDR